MGIRGFKKFLEHYELVEAHRLHDTPVIVDGLNFIHYVYHHYHQKSGDSIFGGNYALLRSHVAQIFTNFRLCNLEVVFILDGAIDPSMEKFNVKMNRAKQELNTSFRVYKDNTCSGVIVPLYTFKMFEVLAKKAGCRVFRTYYEADNTMAQFGRDLHCPVMTNDGDFYIENIPSGVISLDSFGGVWTVRTSEDGSYRYMDCSIFKVDKLLKRFSFRNAHFLPLSGTILGNDFIDHDLSDRLLDKIPHASKCKSKRVRGIYSCLFWLAQFETFDQLSAHLERLKFKSEPMVMALRKLLNRTVKLDEQNAKDPLPLDAYIEDYLERIPPPNSNQAPDWLLKHHLNCNIERLVLTICNVHLDWCQPLVEDFSFVDSSYGCSYSLRSYIYGLLRSAGNQEINVKRFARYGTNFVKKTVPPITNIHGEPLPNVSQLQNLSTNDKLTWFFKILDIDSSSIDRFHALFDEITQSSDFRINNRLVKWTLVQLVALIHFMRHFQDDLWLEFVYALLVNIVLAGNVYQKGAPSLLLLDQNQLKVLRESTSSMRSLPEFSSCKIYMPRIVHYFNCFQTTLQSIEVLINTLNLSTHFDGCSQSLLLSGVFIYNLTANLCARPKPVLYLKELIGRKTFKGFALLDSLLESILITSQRLVDIQSVEVDGDLIPINAPLYDSSGGDCRRLVRGFEKTNRKTHVKSQSIKLRNKK